MKTMYSQPKQQPPYVCAILLCPHSRTLLVEQRPSKPDLPASGMITCFGGKVEQGEHPETALYRELREELGGWQPGHMARTVDLFVDGKLIAYFYLGNAPDRTIKLTFEQGRTGLWFTLGELLLDHRLSGWHASALRAWSAGESRADFSS